MTVSVKQHEIQTFDTLNLRIVLYCMDSLFFLIFFIIIANIIHLLEVIDWMDCKIHIRDCHWWNDKYPVFLLCKIFPDFFYLLGVYNVPFVTEPHTFLFLDLWLLLFPVSSHNSSFNSSGIMQAVCPFYWCFIEYRIVRKKEKEQTRWNL